MGLIYLLMYFSQINALGKVFGVMFIIQGLIFGYFGVINDKIQYRADTTISSAMGITLTRVFRRGKGRRSKRNSRDEFCRKLISAQLSV